MMKLDNNELIQVTGGAITSAMINSVVKLITTVIDFGKMVGTTIRRATTGNIC